MTAADEGVSRQSSVLQTLCLRGGAAMEVQGSADESREPSPIELNDAPSPNQVFFDPETEGCDDLPSIPRFPWLSPLKIQAMVDIVKQIERAFVENPPADHIASLLRLPSTPIHTRSSTRASSPLSSALSSPQWPTAICSDREGSHGKSERTQSVAKKGSLHRTLPKLQRKPSAKASPYFPSSPKPLREAISCIPFPPLAATSFGIVQESLASNPFHLLIAVIFLNKTRGTVAMPVFYTFITRFAEPKSLAAAEHEEVVGFFQNLGLQNQRAKKCIALAKAWLIHPPTKGKRWRRLHYPNHCDGKDIKGDEEPIADETEDGRVAWEVGHLPGIGAYGIDSWRIFCRDQLRGLGTAALPDLPEEDDEAARKKVEQEELGREWTRVLPTDKELRAYLRWRWLRLGWEWDPKTGGRKKATDQVVKDAFGGGVICDGDQGWSLNGEAKQGEIRKLGDLCG